MRRVTDSLLRELEEQVSNLTTSTNKLVKIAIVDTDGEILYVQDVYKTRYDFQNEDGSIDHSSYDVKLCRVFEDLFNTEKRIVNYRGGRGSAKSMAIAIYLLALGAAETHRFLCFREIQNSIRESVHALLRELIESMNLSSFYKITQNEITGQNGTTFLFKGLSDMTADSVKSMQGITLCWGEEASTITDRSLTILIPTIRKEGARFFYSFNPSLDTDAVWQKYVINPPDDCVSIEVNYTDNPFWTSILEKARIDDEKRKPRIEYENIWLGKLLPARQGAVYFNEISKAQDEQRITRVNYDPTLAIHAVFDLGFADHTAIILVQKTLSEIRIIDYIEDNRKTLEEYSSILRNKTNITNWGKVYLPHDGTHADYKTGQTAQEIMTKFGWDVEITPNIHIDTGIRAARQMFGKVYFSNDTSPQITQVTRLIECLKRYRYGERPDGSLTGSPVHDSNSHGADAFRYLAVLHENLPTNMTSTNWGGTLNYRKNSLYR